MRIDAFLAKKKKESAIAATNQTGNPVTSKTASGPLSQVSLSSVSADV